MSLVSLLLLAVCIFAVSTGAMTFITRFYLKRRPAFCPVEQVSAFVLALVCFFSAMYYADLQNVVISAGVLFLLMIAFIYIDIRLSGWANHLSSFLVCLAAVLLLPASLPLFSLVPAVILYPGLGLCMLLIIRLFTFLDKAPWMSLLSIFSQGFLLVLAALFGVLPPEISFSVFAIIVAAVAAVCVMRHWIGQPVLGSCSALVIGFVLGFAWTYFVAFGLGAVPAIVFSAGILQVVWASVATFVSCRYFVPIRSPLLFEQALNTGVKEKKLLYYMMIVLIILSLLAFIVMTGHFQTGISALVITAFILLDMVVRLRKWGAPSPSFRDVASDLKTGIGVLIQEMKHVPLKSDKKNLFPQPEKTGKSRKK